MENYQDQDENEKPSRNGFVKKLRAGGRRITLKFAGTCADCGAQLAVGETARWYGRGRIYGLSCHAESAKPEPKPTPQTQMDFGENEPVAAGGLDESGADDYQPEGEAKKYDCTIH